MTLEHVLRSATAIVVDEYKSTTGSAYIVQGAMINANEIRIPPRAARLGKLYDQLVESTKGYAGRVPLHHKVLVIEQHLDSQQEALAGN